jgi:hypothetical protein
VITLLSAEFDVVATVARVDRDDTGVFERDQGVVEDAVGELEMELQSLTDFGVVVAALEVVDDELCV